MDADACFRALQTRNARFDGKFFVAVKTTGIYCRPICPAKPLRRNVEFYPSAFAAERAGYRPCLRCRPESAPRSPAWIGRTAIVQRAIRKLQDLENLNFNEDEFAAPFGVTARHLRRLFLAEMGKTPNQLAQEIRLNLARQLLTETNLSVTRIAFAAGFGSIRRFNSAFKERFARRPRDVQRTRAGATQTLTLSLAYRPPFDFQGLLQFYRNHQIGDLEWFHDQTMYRLVAAGGRAGWVAIRDDSARSRLMVTMDLPDISLLPGVLGRVRAMFDLDADPVLIANQIERDPGLRRIWRRHRGTRLPSGWDPFEVAIATILGQLVSVERGRSLVADLIRLCGRPVKFGDETRHLFPTPGKIARADLTKLKTTGIRKKCLRDFAVAILESRISLSPAQDVESFIQAVRTIPGIGPWTANYMALKVLRHADAFPATDLILARALAHHPAAVVEGASPWRGYVATLLWREYSEKLKARNL